MSRKAQDPVDALIEKYLALPPDQQARVEERMAAFQQFKRSKEAPPVPRQHRKKAVEQTAQKGAEAPTTIT
jgi:hypothetical protein